MEALINELNHL